MSEISIHELETQYGELLPVRETLGFVNIGSFNTALTAVHQSATAVQALTIDSSNTAANIANVSTGAGIFG